MTHKVLAANKTVASIMIALITAGIISSVGFAWNANSQTAVMQDRVEKLDSAQLPERMVSLEQTVKNTNDKVDTVKEDVKEMRTDINRKLDMIVQNQMQNIKPAR